MASGFIFRTNSGQRTILYSATMNPDGSCGWSVRVVKCIILLESVNAQNIDLDMSEKNIIWYSLVCGLG